jgi:hypothetical protein
MIGAEMLPWLGLLGLGALHGVNPGMGWLFAVALGLQEGRSRAVWSALPPLALGHAFAIALAVGLAAAAGLVVPVSWLKWGVAALLLALGIRRLTRHSHPRSGGMQVSARELTVWSFLMATAHGAGLMVLPIALGLGVADGGGSHGAHHAGPAMSGVTPDHWEAVQITLVHSMGYLVVAGLVAVLVYERLGVRLLRTAWINLDLVWAGALILTGVATMLVG